MKTRILLIASTLLAGLVVGAPMAAAQPAPSITFQVNFSHPGMTVPDTGRADMPVEIKMIAKDFVCPQGAVISADLKLSSFAKWAGASMEPLATTFTIPSNGPGLAPGATINANDDPIHLNLAWDLETAPRTGAKQEYVVTVAPKPLDAACIPNNPTMTGGKSDPMMAELPDRPADVNSTTAVDCASDPFNPACANQLTTAPAESPGIDVGILLAAFAVFAIAMRRRRA